MYFDPETAKRITENGQKIIASVMGQMNLTLNKELEKVMLSFIPDELTAQILNDERSKRIELKRMAMDYFQITLKDIQHDDIDHGINISIDAINSGIQGWYEPAVGKCMKCSMLYFAKVLLNREVAEDMMMSMSDFTIKPNTEHPDSIVSVAHKIISGWDKDVKELASCYLEEHK